MRSPITRSSTAALAFASVLAAGWSFAGSGCRSYLAPDQLAQAVVIGERPVAMAGSGTYFDGAILATVTISRGIGKGLPGVGKGRHAATAALRGPDVNAMDNDEASAYYKARAAVGSPMPPVTMHLKLKNMTANTLSIEMTDFDSDLGNFAVTPSILSLVAGQESEPDPMISQLGVTSDDIPVTVTLKRGEKKETQIVRVKALPAPPSSSPAATAEK